MDVTLHLEGTFVHKDLLDAQGVCRCLCWAHMDIHSLPTRPADADEVLRVMITLTMDPWSPNTQPAEAGSTQKPGQMQ